MMQQDSPLFESPPLDEFNEFFRCLIVDGQWEFQVGVVGWTGPHEPTLIWKSHRRWRTTPDAERLARARASALGNPRFFRTCTRCGERTNLGHMHEPEICQACAERYLGVLH